MRSFFEKLTNGAKMTHDTHVAPSQSMPVSAVQLQKEEETEDVVSELPIDMYTTATEIIIHTMVAGVRPEDITIESTRDTLTITGSRREPRSIGRDQYVNQELYWGSFSRVISLPEEVDADQIEASEKHGLLFIRLPKLDKHRQTRIKIKPF